MASAKSLGAPAEELRLGESDPAVKLMTTTFDAIAKNSKLTTAEALRQGIITVMEDRANPDWANPSAWAPFVLVGEGGVMTR